MFQQPGLSVIQSLTTTILIFRRSHLFTYIYLLTHHGGDVDVEASIIGCADKDGIAVFQQPGLSAIQSLTTTILIYRRSHLFSYIYLLTHDGVDVDVEASTSKLQSLDEQQR